MTEVPGGSSPAATSGAAIRDANFIAQRIGADEAAADAERARLVEGQLPNLNEQLAAAINLRDKEVVHAQRPTAMIENDSAVPEGGSLYLTSQRLLHLGMRSHEIELDTIAETSVSLERLLLLDLTDGSDLAIEVDQPRLLRVQLAAARANARRRTP